MNVINFPICRNGSKVAIGTAAEASTPSKR